VLIVSTNAPAGRGEATFLFRSLWQRRKMVKKAHPSLPADTYDFPWFSFGFPAFFCKGPTRTFWWTKVRPVRYAQKQEKSACFSNVNVIVSLRVLWAVPLAPSRDQRSSSLTRQWLEDHVNVETACCAQGEQTVLQGMSQSRVMISSRMLVGWPHASGSRKELHILCPAKAGLRFATRVCHSRTTDF
jgi:hypothetical protein